MKTIDEAIQHFTEKAEELREEANKLCEIGPGLSGHDLNSRFDCLERAEDCDQYAAWLKELKARQDTEPIVYEVTEYSQGFTVETHDDRNIGLRKVSSSDLDYVMGYITEKYWDKGLKVVFKYYCGNGDEWEKIYKKEENEK